MCNSFRRADRFMYEYSVDIDLNFKSTKSYCVAFTPKLYMLALPSLHINHLPISYTDSIKYFGYILLSTEDFIKETNAVESG